MLSEKIFVNKQFLDDLNSNCNITLCKYCLSKWGYYPNENFQAIIDAQNPKDYIDVNIIGNNNTIYIADTFIEDDLVCLSLPNAININLEYSIVLFYNKESNNVTQENLIACIIYTQNLYDAAVIPLVNYADNRIYLDLRSLPLKAHLLTFMSPYQSPVLEATTEHAPVFHKHLTKPSNITPEPNSTDYNSASCLPNSYTDSLAVVAAIAENCELDTSADDNKINEDGIITSNYITADQDAVEFFRNKIGCAYEWAHSKLCTEDLVDAQNIVLISDLTTPINS